MARSVETMLKEFSVIRKVYAKTFTQLFGNEDLSPNEINILLFLSNNPSIDTSKQLVYFLDVSKGLICRSIDSLVKKGYVISEPDIKDRRIQRLKLSSNADPVIEQLSEVNRYIDTVVLEAVSKEEIERTKVTLEKILNKFNMILEGDGVNENKNVKRS